MRVQSYYLPREATKEEFILNSGVTCHVVKDSTQMTDIQKKQEEVIVGDKSRMVSHHQGTLNLLTECGNTLKLQNVLVIPDIAMNLISGLPSRVA